MLLGRRAECEVLDQALTDARAGRSRVVVLRGEAGIGKTALLDFVSGRLDGWRVTGAVGLEAELELAYSGLHQICSPMLDELERIPRPQRDALATVFGLISEGAPNRFLVGLATLTLFAEIAEQRPLAIIVDDAHWLDQQSEQVLGFVARRLLAERIAIVCAARTGIGEHVLVGLPELPILGLHDTDARSLLLGSMVGAIDAAVLQQIITESQGNPLALIELGRLSSVVDFARGFGVPGGERVTEKIERTYARRLDALPSKTRLLVLLAAAEPRGDRLLLDRAAAILGVEMAALIPAVDADLIKVNSQVAFAHPLARSVAYHNADPEDRHLVHAALAEATDKRHHPDRCAWHRARASPEPNEEIATELEQSAVRAQSRGGVAATAAFLEQALVLTADPGRRAERAVAAAEASFHAGAFDAAERLLATAELDGLDGFLAARALLLRGHLAAALKHGAAAAPLLLKAAKELATYDIDLAREAYLTAYGSAFAAAHLGQEGVMLEICRAIEDLPPPEGTEDAKSLLLEGLARMHTDGRSVAIPILRRAAKSLAQMTAEDVIRWGWMAPTASHVTWDSEAAGEIFERQARTVRDAGALAELPMYLESLALDRVWSGDFAEARLLIAEGESVAAATGSELPPFGALRLLSLEGKEAEASSLIAATLKSDTERGQGMAVRVAQWAGAVLFNGLARYDKAAAAARQVTANDIDPYPGMWVLPELIEAASRLGEVELARTGLRRLAELTEPAGTDWAIGTLSRSEALLSEDETADRLYRDAIKRFGRTRLRPELARAHLLYGEWLRREGRRVDSRGQLEIAHDMLATLGMRAFAERARRELLATGAKARKRRSDTRGDLTAQEAQIAELARGGRSNPEIAAELFLSPRTVEWHLRKVFVKLNISSRKELEAALGRSGRELQLQG